MFLGEGFGQLQGLEFGKDGYIMIIRLKRFMGTQDGSLLSVDTITRVFFFGLS